jgi:hypothetical protein
MGKVHLAAREETGRDPKRQPETSYLMDQLPDHLAPKNGRRASNCIRSTKPTNEASHHMQ